MLWHLGPLDLRHRRASQEYADSVTEDYIAEGIWDEEGFAEPYWLEPPSSPEEVEAIVEQSPDYFNRYIAGDK